MKKHWLFAILSFSLFSDVTNAEDVSFVYRQPASFETPRRDFLYELTGKIDSFLNHETVLIVSDDKAWNQGDILAIESQFKDAGVVAFVEVKQIRRDGSRRLLECQLLRSTRRSFVQIGDRAFRLDLTKESPNYKGSTELLVKKTKDTISSKYHYLVTQGLTIGDTAQTLQENEVMASWYSQIYYGWSPNLMVGTLLLGNLAGAPNIQGKWRFFQSESNVFSLGLNMAKIPTEPKTTINATFYWDSISSESVISHTYISLALLSLEKAEDSTAIKAFGSSSIQTGYEFIQDDWNRVLVGPTYSFQNNAVGGYLGYMKIWDRFHFLFALNSTNIAEFQQSTKNGYFFFFDAFWRF